MADLREDLEREQATMAELKYPFKTAAQCRREAFRRLAKVRPEDEVREKPIMQGKFPITIKVKIAKLTVAEILAEDNKVRAEAPKSFKLRQIREYPIQLDEYNPATKKATWKKLIGGEIMMEPNKLPYALPVWQECEGFDASENIKVLEAEIDAECEKFYPTREPTKEERAAVRNSLIQRKEVEIAKAQEETSTVASNEPEIETPKKGKAKTA